MNDQGPIDTNNASALEGTEPPKLKRGRASKTSLVNDDQMSLFERIGEKPPSRVDVRVTVDPVPGIETSEGVISVGGLKADPGAAKTAAHAELMKRFPSLEPFQSDRPETARARLVEMLNDCLIAGHVPRGFDEAKINRMHFADALGVTGTSVRRQSDVLAAYEAILGDLGPVVPEYTRFGAKITKEAEDHFSPDVILVMSKYPQLFKHQFYPTDHNAGRVVALLNGQVVSGNIERSRGGKLSRQWLTDRLGVTQTAIMVYLEIVEDYEKAIGGVESESEAKIPEMRRWLDDSMANGTLETRDSKLARMQLYSQFKLPKNSLVLLRYPRIAAVVEEYDRLIQSTGYQPTARADKIEALRALLADDPEINKDGRTINRDILNKALGLPPNTLSRSPYSEMLREADESLRVALEADSLILQACGRIFKFRGLVDAGWPEKFIIRLKQSFERNYRTKKKDDAKRFYAVTIDLLDHIVSDATPACTAVKAALIAGEPLKSIERNWTMLTQEYRDVIGQRYVNRQSANGILGTINVCLRKYWNDGVLPPHTLNLVSFREDNKQHLRSVAEVTVDTGPKRSTAHVDEYLKFATSMLAQASISYEVEIGANDQNDFNKVLRAELERQDFKAAETPASVILRVLERRLQLLEEAAIHIVDTDRKAWEYGQALIERGIDPGEEWSLIIDRQSINQVDRRQALRKFFPKDGGENEQGIANILKVVVQRYESQYPSNVLSGRPEGQFFQKRALEYGGALKLQSYITPTQSAVAAVNTLYLLASGSNVTVGREMYFECIETSEEPRHSRVTGYKSRAGGKPIFITLEDKSPAIRGMRWLQHACETSRSHAGDDFRQLFVCRANGGGFKMIEEWTYRQEFKTMVASIPELADLPLTPNMLRPSILLRTVLQSDGRNRLSMALGQHGAKVHDGYTDKFPTRYLRDIDARRFLHTFETVVIQPVAEALDFLGLTPEAFERRVETVMKTGLGTMCADRRGRPGNNGEICTSVDCWNDCPQLLVIARAKDIAILQIWQHSLRAVEGDWVRDQPERWGKVWLPWLSFVDAVEIKMRQPTFLKVWKEATELADQFKADPKFQPMRLF